MKKTFLNYFNFDSIFIKINFMQALTFVVIKISNVIETGCFVMVRNKRFIKKIISRSILKTKMSLLLLKNLQRIN